MISQYESYFLFVKKHQIISIQCFLNFPNQMYSVVDIQFYLNLFCTLYIEQVKSFMLVARNPENLPTTFVANFSEAK